MSPPVDADAAPLAVPAGSPLRPAGLEARSHQRARAHWPARLINATGTLHAGWICDVSEGGFGVMSAVHMPVGSLLEVALAVPLDTDGKRSAPVRCKVRVVFCAFAGVQSRLGVQFLALPNPTRLAIRQYVQHHA